MNRPLAHLLALLLAAAPAALAQDRDAQAPRPKDHPAASEHTTTPLRSDTAQPGLVQTPAQPCVEGPCTNAAAPVRPHAHIIPARTSSSEIIQNGGVPGSTGVRAVTGGTAILGSDRDVPAPDQPLGNVLIRQRDSVRITIRAISAERAGASLEIDGRLGPIDHDLRSFADQFSYRSYRLLDVQSFELDFRSIAQMELPGNRSIEVEPRLLAPDGRVKVHLELLGQHPDHSPRMRTDYSIPRGRTILVGGYKIDPDFPEHGTLLIAITQDE